MIFRNFEIYIKNIIKGKNRSPISFLVLSFLYPLSIVFKCTVGIRNWLYEHHWMRKYIPPVPLVISVGNIVAGGTGKTPVTGFLAQFFYERFSLALISRGYRSQAEKLEHPLILCEGNGPLFPPEFCGDEPYLLAKRFPKALVIVGRDRRKASSLAAKDSVKIIILDDAMQHRSLDRDFDVVVIDANDPYGQGYHLPRGFLRESVKSLSRADLIVINHIDNQEQFESLSAQLKQYSSAPMMGTRVGIKSIQTLKGGSIPSLQGKNLGIFCSIAHPDYFKMTVESQGAKVVSELHICDHGKFLEKDLERFAKKSLKCGADYLICTEKDRVKLVDSLELVLPVIWIEMDIKIVAGEESWSQFTSLAESKIKE